MPLLTIHNLTCYFQGLCAVSSFSAAIEERELVGIIGPNGAGKTTVFNLISGLYTPTSGKILYQGKDIVGLPPYTIAARGIARTFQNIRLFGSLSVLDNVRTAFYAQTRHSFVEALLHLPRHQREERANSERARRLLQLLGLDQHLDETAGSLPYGLQRRLEIARALAAKPKLLLLDEPAAGMNPREVQDLIALIQEVKHQFDLTVLLIEHQMPLVMGLCDRIIVLDFGEKIAEGSPQEISKNPVVLEAYLGEDFHD